MAATVHICVIALLIQASTASVGGPDFSGAWTLFNIDGVKIADQVAAQLQDKIASEKTLVVKQTANELSINRQEDERKTETKYTIGGKGKGSATWDGKKLDLRRTIELTVSNRSLQMETEEVWSLSEDRKMLVIEWAVHAPLAIYHYQLAYKLKVE